MAQLEVRLSIGYTGASHEDVIEIDDSEFAKCNSEEEKNAYLEEEWKEWANGYIEASFRLIQDHEISVEEVDSNEKH